MNIQQIYVCLSIFLSISLYTYSYLPIYPSIYASIYLSVYIYISHIYTHMHSSGNLFGASALEAAAGYGAREAWMELIRRAKPSQLDLSRALYGALSFWVPE